MLSELLFLSKACGNMSVKKYGLLLAQIDDYSMVRFLPFDRTDEEGINIVLQHIDFSIQYGEDLEFKEPKELNEEPSNTNFDEFFQGTADS
ncbi:GPN-loop GTPase [Pimephales promelas]|nr:GPN-loop GTPase [Pimephales promelas]